MLLHNFPIIPPSDGDFRNLQASCQAYKKLKLRREMCYQASDISKGLLKAYDKRTKSNCTEPVESERS